MKLRNEKGFTLIELMIVIAIIGVLAAIAIPNFISYRNKSYCAQSEGDAKAVLAAVASYFSVPTRTDLPATVADLKTYEKGLAIGTYTTATLDKLGGDINSGISVTLTKDDGKCPRGKTYTSYMGTSLTGTWTP